MAEIKVQKKGPSAWLWILGLVAAAVVVMVLANTWNDHDPDAIATGPVAAVPPPDTAPTTGVREPAPAAVAAFLAFTDGPAAAAGSPAGPAHEYAADGIRRLTQALRAVIEPRNDGRDAVRDQFAAFQAKADRIQADPQAMQHAEQVRDVFMSAADLMSAAQTDRWPQAAELREQIVEVRSAGGAMNAERPLLDQTAVVERFFDRAAVVVRTMSERD